METLKISISISRIDKNRSSEYVKLQNSMVYQFHCWNTILRTYFHLTNPSLRWKICEQKNIFNSSKWQLIFDNLSSSFHFQNYYKISISTIIRHHNSQWGFLCAYLENSLSWIAITTIRIMIIILPHFKGQNWPVVWDTVLYINHLTNLDMNYLIESILQGF